MAEPLSSRNKALFINCLRSKKKAIFESILKELTGDQECCSSDSYVWLVDNKYYTASILLKSSCTDDGGKISLVADNYEAVVILIDFTDAPDVESLASTWSEITSQLSSGQTQFQLPDVCIVMVVVTGHDNEQSLKGVLKWCVANGFELIEWSASKGNTMGVARLAEALHAHVWPTMSMKPCGQSDIHATKDMSAEEQLLAVGLDAAEQDPGGESFEKMFAKFTEMKEHAEKLPHEERKAYAEKVVMAFWDAIGGDEEEVRDLT